MGYVSGTDPRSIADAIESALDAPPDIRQASRQAFLQEFDLKNTVADVRKILCSIARRDAHDS